MTDDRPRESLVDLISDTSNGEVFTTTWGAFQDYWQARGWREATENEVVAAAPAEVTAPPAPNVPPTPQAPNTPPRQEP